MKYEISIYKDFSAVMSNFILFGEHTEPQPDAKNWCHSHDQ